MLTRIALLESALAAGLGAPLAAQSCKAGAPVAFIGADVLTMNDTSLLRGQTVLIEAGRIVAIGAPSLGANVCRIEAAGKVLLPGLADMHAHMTEADLPLFLANGVTLVREMNGSPTHVSLRERLARGEIVGPRLVVASPLLTGKPLQFRHRLIESRDDAYAAAHEAKDAGYEFLKIYDDLSEDQYDAFVEAGQTLGLPLDGHVPSAAGLTKVVASGQAIQHMDKIAFALAGHAPDSADALLPQARRIFSGKRIWVTPTLASLGALDRAGTAEYAARFQRPEMAYVDSGTIGWWRSLVRDGRRPDQMSRFYRFQLSLLRTLRETDTRFLLGTDAPNPLMIPGFSVHDELETLVRDGGFTPYEALLTATRNPAEFLGDAAGGRVQVGARADLLLVDANPLASLATLKAPHGVMVSGRWISRAELDAGLRSAVRSTP